MSNILVVDDDQQLAHSFEKLLGEEGYDVRTAPTGEAGVAMVRERVPDLVVMDVRMPGMSGLEALERIRKIDPKLPVIIMTAFSTTETAIEAIKLGAFDYCLKPFEIPDILLLIEKAIESGRFMRETVAMESAPAEGGAEALIGRHESMQEVYKAIGRVASTEATVLIRGESGTGKELVARAVYQHSRRGDKPFLVINCVAIPETLLESELFGYERGAFTGAAARKIGKIEQAQGGTVLLDEIGDMPLSIQAKILRLLQERTLERLGGHEPVRVDVRIIAATNRNLESALVEGRFREDLYYRLKVVTIELPRLRDRREDIPVLTDYFLARFSREMGIANPGITEEARGELGRCGWPGNVRELGNALQKALIFSRGYPIREDDIFNALNSRGPGPDRSDQEIQPVIEGWVRSALIAGDVSNSYSRLADHFSAIIVGEALKLTSGNRTQAARLLGLSRPTLQAKIEKYNLKLKTTVDTD